MSKTIQFMPEMPHLDIPQPAPSVKFLPEWYKNIPSVGKDKIITVKTCIPFLDSMTAGYMIPTPCDLEFGNGEWRHNSVLGKPVSSHTQFQIENAEIDSDLDELHPWKFNNNWRIVTPKGYSTLFVHPTNRTELPFRSITGFVDTDVHPVVINFPFLLKKGWEGTIPAGTPMIQAIPVKRDDWEMNIRNLKPDEKQEYNSWRIMNPPFGVYKKNWWQRKSYK